MNLNVHCPTLLMHYIRFIKKPIFLELRLVILNLEYLLYDPIYFMSNSII